MFDRIAEEKILDAIKSGAFDDLPGFGKPIDWKPLNPYADEWAITYDILQTHNITLPWIEKRKEIEQDLKKAVQNCESNLNLSSDIAFRQFFKEIQAINQKIFDYNLSVPVSRLQRRQLEAEVLFNRIKNSNSTD
ncbi:MAG: hypothetical protein CL609_23945 [Anaerolineaceae bacterium]|nr:hypothetical protein [Anaerolineaceae bacterium]